MLVAWGNGEGVWSGGGAAGVVSGHDRDRLTVGQPAGRELAQAQGDHWTAKQPVTGMSLFNTPQRPLQQIQLLSPGGAQKR